jgi:CRISPR-associated protein Cmr5
MSLQKTQEQRRAAKAWEQVSGVKGKSHAGKYGSLAKKFPMLVLTNGLGHALAFLRAKNKAHHAALYGHLSAWVTEQVYGKGGGDEKLLERLIGAVSGCASNSDVYRRATTEALAYIAWIKRFAEAELPLEEDTD